MSIPYLQLFLDKFISYNLARYNDKPDFVSKLGKLTLSDVTFTNYAEEVLQGQTSRIIDLSVPQLFIAQRQHWRPVPYINTKLTNLADPVIQDPADLLTKPAAGIYLIDDNGTPRGVVVVLKGNKTSVGIKNVITLNCLYDIDENDIVVSDDLSSVSINAPTIVGDLLVVESSQVSQIFTYDGTYFYDGTMTY